MKPLFLSKIKTKEKVIYLTFDDGPHPEATNFVLNELQKINARATFFCLGKNVESHPEIYHRILESGHKTGNHSYSHFNGWKTPAGIYVEDVFRAEKLIQSKWFRPPYGRISPIQFIALRKRYRIVFWTMLARDYNPAVQPKVEIDRLLKGAKEGSIIVFHDSGSSFPQMKQILPEVLKVLTVSGYRFENLPEV